MCLLCHFSKGSEHQGAPWGPLSGEARSNHCQGWMESPEGEPRPHIHLASGEDVGKVLVLEWAKRDTRDTSGPPPAKTFKNYENYLHFSPRIEETPLQGVPTRPGPPLSGWGPTPNHPQIRPSVYACSGNVHKTLLEQLCFVSLGGSCPPKSSKH